MGRERPDAPGVHSVHSVQGAAGGGCWLAEDSRWCRKGERRPGRGIWAVGALARHRHRRSRLLTVVWRYASEKSFSRDQRLQGPGRGRLVAVDPDNQPDGLPPRRLQRDVCGLLGPVASDRSRRQQKKNTSHARRVLRRRNSIPPQSQHLRRGCGTPDRTAVRHCPQPNQRLLTSPT